MLAGVSVVLCKPGVFVSSLLLLKPGRFLGCCEPCLFWDSAGTGLAPEFSGAHGSSPYRRRFVPILFSSIVASMATRSVRDSLASVGVWSSLLGCRYDSARLLGRVGRFGVAGMTFLVIMVTAHVFIYLVLFF